MNFKVIEWKNGKVKLLDQTRLPQEIVYLELDDYKSMATAIQEMRIRGAPALGLAAAYGMALGAQESNTQTKEEFLRHLQVVAQALIATRPTAVNLPWAIERMERVAASAGNVPQIKAALIAEARRLEAETEASDRRLGQWGAELIPDVATVLTHCNAGTLATGGYGTALGVIRAAAEQGKRIRVFADETRPLLQGARLTAWELVQYKIPVTLITDNMAGHFLSRGEIQCVIVGADRIAANGDVANKIGTYPLAVVATENGVPFYVAAPTSTIDLSLASGKEIPIEERASEEVTHFRGVATAPEGVEVANPAFDVTPHQYISAIITEEGIVREPYGDRLKKLMFFAQGREAND
ncbi:MAG: S-methyl-5-thioribose-1-phosphate isomerase [Chloroflexi bacterium]|nr:S-methyl-5-thioribose-1-phosphate isomerase [Chloroflexota bacterium]